MNFSEAIAVYLSESTYENVCNDSFEPKIKLIFDRGTKRIYTSDGGQFVSTIDNMASEAWYVVRNQ